MLTNGRRYIECGTQTSPVRSFTPTRAGEPRSAITRLRGRRRGASDGYLSSSFNNTPSSSHSFSSTRLDTAYSHSVRADSVVLSPMSSGVEQRISRNCRQHLGHGQPSEPDYPIKQRAVTHSGSVVRPVSPAPFAKDATMRIVSLPERPKPAAMEILPLPFRFRACSSNKSLPHSDGQPPHSRGRTSTASDVPHTPSPPSSPESSVLIIGNDVHVPRTFLCEPPDDVCSEYTDDGGWITWANSPPRPIPALHGPLSLPYARCPSGAEGTVIEGADTINGMIWGLGAEEELVNRPRLNTANLPSHVAPSNSQPGNVLPKLRKNATSSSTHDHPYSGNVMSSNASTRCSPQIRQDAQTRALWQQHHAVDPRHFENNSETYTMTYGLSRNKDTLITNSVSQTRKASVPRSMAPSKPNLHDQIGLGLCWQPVSSSENERLNEARRRNQDISNRLQATATTFIPHRRSVASADPRSGLYAQLNVLNVPSRRLSAMEIAQQYRQHQMQTGLPTPPDSFTSQWSPQFDSCQDLLHHLSISPPLLQPNILTPGQKPHRHASRQVHPSVSGRFDVLYNSPQRYGLSSTIRHSAMPVMSSALPRTPQISNTRTSRELTSYARHDESLSPPYFSPSPARPRPPPNTPIDSVPMAKTLSPLAGLPSPTSPEPRVTLQFRYPFSVPSARLIQRRLSAVPEEETTFIRESFSSSPDATRAPASSLGFRSPALLHHSSKITSLVPDASQTRADCLDTSGCLSDPHDDLDALGVSGVVPVNVRLPPRVTRRNEAFGRQIVSPLPVQATVEQGFSTYLQNESQDGDSPARARAIRRKRNRKPKIGEPARSLVHA